MKKYIIVLFVAILCIIGNVFGDDIISEDLNIVIDGEALNTFDDEQGIEVKPFIYNNRTVVPIRVLSNAFGIDDAQITWRSDTKSVVIVTNSNNTIIAQVGNMEIQFDDKVLTTDVAPVIMKNRLYLPLSAIATLYNVDVEWDADTRTVSLNPSTYVMKLLDVQFNYPVNEKYALTLSDREYDEEVKYLFGKNDIERNLSLSSIILSKQATNFDDFFQAYLIENNLSSNDFDILSDEKKAVVKYNGMSSIAFVELKSSTIVLDSYDVDKEMLETIADTLSEEVE
jgi:hypothetical protein